MRLRLTYERPYDDYSHASVDSFTKNDHSQNGSYLTTYQGNQTDTYLSWRDVHGLRLAVVLFASSSLELAADLGDTKMSCQNEALSVHLHGFAQGVQMDSSTEDDNQTVNFKIGSWIVG